MQDLKSFPKVKSTSHKTDRKEGNKKEILSNKKEEMQNEGEKYDWSKKEGRSRGTDLCLRLICDEEKISL